MTDHLDLNLKFELVGTHTELDLPKGPDFQARSKCELSMKVRSGGPPERRRSSPGLRAPAGEPPTDARLPGPQCDGHAGSTGAGGGAAGGPDQLRGGQGEPRADQVELDGAVVDAV